YEICLDEVDRLGSFVEVETFSDDGDPEKIQEEIFKFLLSLGVKPEDRVREGYDTLVYLKNLKTAK
ncbi:MAG: CYTH domain-containing protein, partial [bacterium]|nr:CYTH domain-containing protein [bacterium]